MGRLTALLTALNGNTHMPRPLNPDLTKNWKITLPATLAGTVELYLFDRLHNKPIYGSRAKLISSLLQRWVDEQQAAARTNERKYSDARN